MFDLKLACRTASAAALCLLLAQAAEAAPRYTAKITTTVQTGHPLVVGMEKFSARVKELTNGDVDVRVFPSSQLGGEVESLEGMKLGSVQGGMITSSVFSQWAPAFELIDLPFVFKDDQHAQKACEGFFQEKLAPMLKPHGFRSLGCFNFGGRHLISTFPITELSDVKGKKMRVLLNPLHVRMWQLAGANPTPIPAAEVYSSLQTRVVDYIDNPKSTYLSFKWYEVAKHFTLLGHVNSIIFLTFSDAWFEKLPAEHKAAMEKAAKEVLPTINAALMADDDASLAKTVQGGATVHQVKDRDAWRVAMSPTWDDYTKRVPEGAVLLKQLTDLK